MPSMHLIGSNSITNRSELERSEPSVDGHIKHMLHILECADETHIESHREALIRPGMDGFMGNSSLPTTTTASTTPRSHTLRNRQSCCELPSPRHYLQRVEPIRSQCDLEKLNLIGTCRTRARDRFMEKVMINCHIYRDQSRPNHM